MCVLSGCDYLPSVPGVGIKAAHKLVARHREPKQLLRALRFQFDVKVPLGYERGFCARKAILAERNGAGVRGARVCRIVKRNLHRAQQSLTRNYATIALSVRRKA